MLDIEELRDLDENFRFIKLVITCKNSVIIGYFEDSTQSNILCVTDKNHVGQNFKIDLNTNIIYEFGVNDLKQWTIKDQVLNIEEIENDN